EICRTNCACRARRQGQRPMAETLRSSATTSTTSGDAVCTCRREAASCIHALARVSCPGPDSHSTRASSSADMHSHSTVKETCKVRRRQRFQNGGVGWFMATLCCACSLKSELLALVFTHLQS